MVLVPVRALVPVRTLVFLRILVPARALVLVRAVVPIRTVVLISFLFMLLFSPIWFQTGFLLNFFKNGIRLTVDPTDIFTLGLRSASKCGGSACC